MIKDWLCSWKWKITAHQTQFNHASWVISVILGLDIYWKVTIRVDHALFSENIHCFLVAYRPAAERYRSVLVLSWCPFSFY